MTQKLELGAIPILGSNSYIRYDRLSEMTNIVFAGSTAEECNIYIDLYSLFYKLYTQLYNPMLDNSDNCIAAVIINTIAHYRRFFWTRYKVKCKFILVYSSNTPSSAQIFYPDYNSTFATSMKVSAEVHKKVIDNLKLVDMIIPYIEDSTLVIGMSDVSALIYNAMTKIGNNNPNIIITQDKSVMQLLAFPNTVIYRPKKKGGIDESYFVLGNGNGPYINFVGSAENKYMQNIVEINPGLYSLFLAMTKCPERNMKSLITTSSAITSLNRAIESGSIINGYNTDIYSVIDQFDTKVKNTLRHGSILERFRAIDTTDCK